jgi:hypothetical protein
MLQLLLDLGYRVVDTLVRGIIFEPMNAVSPTDDGGLAAIVTEAEHTYFDGLSPDYLPEYLLDMAFSETNLDNVGPTMLLCQGVGDRKHLFLGRTGWSRCSGCNEVVCGSCSTMKQVPIDKVSKKTKCRLCLGCYATEMLVPSNTLLTPRRPPDALFFQKASRLRLPLVRWSVWNRRFLIKASKLINT